MSASRRAGSAGSGSARRLALGLALLAGLGASGCVSGTEVRADVALGRSPGAAVEGVPFVAQQGPEDCGATAVEVVLSHAGRPVDRADLERRMVRSSVGGSFTFDIGLAVRRAGLHAWERTGASLEDLRAWIRAGHPPIVLLAIRPLNTGYKHFVVATGLDERRGVVLLHDGREADAPVALDDFLERWEGAGRWALAAVPPEAALPSGFTLLDARERARLGYAAERHAGERSVSERSAAERSLALDAARAHYAAAVSLDPSLTAARGNLGRLHLLGGHLPEAERELREALRLAPGDVRARNNLAFALLQQAIHEPRDPASGDRLAEAEALSRDALVAAPADLAPSCRDTLDRILARRDVTLSGQTR